MIGGVPGGRGILASERKPRGLTTVTTTFSPRNPWVQWKMGVSPILISFHLRFSTMISGRFRVIS